MEDNESIDLEPVSMGSDVEEHKKKKKKSHVSLLTKVMLVLLIVLSAVTGYLCFTVDGYLSSKNADMNVLYSVTGLDRNLDDLVLNRFDYKLFFNNRNLKYKENNIYKLTNKYEINYGDESYKVKYVYFRLNDYDRLEILIPFKKYGKASKLEHYLLSELKKGKFYVTNHDDDRYDILLKKTEDDKLCCELSIREGSDIKYINKSLNNGNKYICFNIYMSSFYENY